jgi:hypothetical protein
MTLQLSHIFLTEALTFITRPPFPPEFPASNQTGGESLADKRPIKFPRHPTRFPIDLKLPVSANCGY